VVVTQPLYASVSDVFGRKGPLYLAFVFFLAGSLTFALAQTMETVIAGRLLQGLGGGGLNVLCDIVVADMTTLQERSLYYGLQAIPIAIGTILGPTVGALFSTYASWRWIGWVNLPLLGIAFPLVFFFLRLRPLETDLKDKLARLDWLGLALFAVGATVLVIPLSWAGNLYAWGAWQTLVPLLLGLAVLAVFGVYESRPVAPVVPYRLFRSRTAVMTMIGGFAHGMILYPLLQYLPLFFQAVMLQGVLPSAVSLLPTSIISCVFAGIATAALTDAHGGYRLRLRILWILTTLGSGLLALLDPASPRSMGLGIPVIWGAGIGGLLQLLLLPMQASVKDVDDIGMAVGLLVSVRILGGLVGVAIGAAVFGTVFGSAIAAVNMLPDSLALLRDPNQAVALIPTLRNLDLPLDVMAPILHAYLDAIRAVFYTMTGFGGIGILTSIFTEALGLQREELGQQRFEQ
jgi:hypothetical protein